MVKWQLFPRSARPAPIFRDLIGVFQTVHGQIDSTRHQLESDGVLRALTPGLGQLGFRVETGKTADQKIHMPVLFGLDGAVEKSFNADAFHEGEGVVLEVEAGRAVANNAYLKDLFQACMMQDARHLVIAVRSAYRGSDDFEKVRVVFDTLYTSNRLRLPLETVVVIGY